MGTTILYVGQKARIDCTEKYQGSTAPGPLPIAYAMNEATDAHVTLTPSTDPNHLSCIVEAIAGGGDLTVFFTIPGVPQDSERFTTVTGVDEVTHTVTIIS